MGEVKFGLGRSYLARCVLTEKVAPAPPTSSAKPIRPAASWAMKFGPSETGTMSRKPTRELATGPATAAIAAVAGPVASSLVGFLDIVPVSLGPNFIAQLAAGLIGFALLVGGAGATFSVRTHLAK